MAQPRQHQQRRRRSVSGGLRLLAALLVLLSLCCLARLDVAAAKAASAASTDWNDEVATALEKAAAQEAGHGFTATTAEKEEGPAAVPARVAMEVIQDYPSTTANSRHMPHIPHP